MGESYEPRSECPINASIEVFGDRWSLLVLRDIVFGDRRYFRELQANSIEGIASNILADRLKRLVESGLLTREDTRPGQRARYSLTEPAIQLVPAEMPPPVRITKVNIGQPAVRGDSHRCSGPGIVPPLGLHAAVARSTVCRIRDSRSVPDPAWVQRSQQVSPASPPLRLPRP